MSSNDMAAYLFHQGTNFRTYDYLGAHVNKDEVVFRVWAPNADAIFLAFDGNDWTGDGWEFARLTDQGIWELKVPLVLFPEGSFYKYKIVKGEVFHLKADPYAFFSQTLSETASVFIKEPDFSWTDDEYLSLRKKIYTNKKLYPMNIYECHLGSWQRNEDGSYLNWIELAHKLSEYLVQMSFTHVELLPITEHPFDGSWGYQVGSFYSPTARFGTPDQFMEFVNILHGANIGVIMDWVPAHFPKDEHGLYEFDGTLTYEYQGVDRMENPVWGTRYFDVGRNEVQCFLISNLFFWAEKYHIDGFRMDAVSSMLYLDFDRKPGEWFPNPDGSKLNNQSVAFFKRMNSCFKSAHPDILLIAEESEAAKGLTSPASQGGLGFDYKWNMGWMNDTLSYFETDPLFRKHKHSKLTFPLMYSFDESYILPFSHDETVHGKKSLIDKQPGEYEQKFASLRAMMAYMIAFPGKKLSFMGNEYAQFREWDFDNSLEWFMLDYPKHKMHQRFIADLNRFYLSSPPLWEDDFGWDGFSWSLVNEADINLIAFERIGRRGKSILCIFNLSPVDRFNLRVPVKKHGNYSPIFTTEKELYGGTDYPIIPAKTNKDDPEAYITINIKGHSASFYTKDKF